MTSNITAQPRSIDLQDLLDELLGLEELSEVENLPRGQTEKATHGEEGEVEDTGVGRLIGVTHLLLIKKLDRD